MIEIQKAIIALFKMKSLREFDDWGTATLIRFGNHHFLITAAHVMDMFEEEGKITLSGNIKIKPGSRKVLRTNTSQIGERNDDKIDLAAFKFADVEVTSLENLGRQFFPSGEIVWNDPWSKGKKYLFTGYPFTGVKLRGEIDPLCMTMDIQGMPPAQMKSMGFDSRLHIGAHFNRENMQDHNKKKLTAKHPKGMSGGPVTIRRRGLFGESFRLAGIGIEYHASKKVIVGTKAYTIAGLLKSEFPEIKPYLPKELGV